MYIYIYTCLHVNIQICVYIYIYTYTCVCVCDWVSYPNHSLNPKVYIHPGVFEHYCQSIGWRVLLYSLESGRWFLLMFRGSSQAWSGLVLMNFIGAFRCVMTGVSPPVIIRFERWDFPYAVVTIQRFLGVPPMGTELESSASPMEWINGLLPKIAKWQPPATIKERGARGSKHIRKQVTCIPPPLLLDFQNEFVAFLHLPTTTRILHLLPSSATIPLRTLHWDSSCTSYMKPDQFVFASVAPCWHVKRGQGEVVLEQTQPAWYG